MPHSSVPSPGLASFLNSVKSRPVEASIAHLILLLKHRQIRNSRSCAIATAHLLRKIVAAHRVTDVSELIERIQIAGQRLAGAQPKELAVGNIVRRVLAVIRVEAEENREGGMSKQSKVGAERHSRTPERNVVSEHHQDIDSSASNLLRQTISDSPRSPRPTTDVSSGSVSPQNAFQQPDPTLHLPYANSNNAPAVTSMFSLLSQPTSRAKPPSTLPDTQSLRDLEPKNTKAQSQLSSTRDLRAEVIEGIEEIIDELNQVDDMIAGYALDHIHVNEIILTYTSSVTVQNFLLRAATKRKFTVVYAEAFPNEHEGTHTVATRAVKPQTENNLSPEVFQKSLSAAGITVILIPDAAVFAIMARVNKVILGTHVVLANGGLVAAAGVKVIAEAASAHKVPIVVLTGIYKLSPIYAFDVDSLIENGDTGKIFGYEEGDLVQRVGVINPLFDYVPPDLVDLYITNL
ncbi:MAG: hypothetical protein LQ351_004755 [Letrouitia transgressa]|nr:MAG: hypothetical protein LQ351_004755 [Letrouitia transgressa]